MMKIIFRYLVSLYILFLFSTVVHAEEYYCSYKTKINDDEKNIGFTINSNENTIIHDKSDDAVISFFEQSFILDGYLNSDYSSDEKLISSLDNKCVENLYICEFVHLAPGASNNSSKKYGVLFHANLYSQIALKETYKVTLTDEFYAWGTHPMEDCRIAVYNGAKSTAESNNELLECDYYNRIVKGVNNGEESVKSLRDLYCSSSEAQCDNSEYYANKEKIKGFCSSIMKYSDYIDPCIPSCIRLNEEIQSIEGKSQSNNCGLSQKLLAWILNIMKWGKYIVPVIVILLGMVDFIRGFVSDKDDGLKKAQGRFARRLIAAALIFIAPLIITFILEKMGFTSSMCGIKF